MQTYILIRDDAFEQLSAATSIHGVIIANDRDRAREKARRYLDVKSAHVSEVEPMLYTVRIKDDLHYFSLIPADLID